MSQPQLSIVLAVRNDNYGGDFTTRLQNCISWNSKWLKEFGINAEFILVNWNPIAENDSIKDLINWPTERGCVKFKLLNVSNSVHQDFVDPTVRDNVPMFEFIAKNTGIRRAIGKYILCINADILIAPDILSRIAKNELGSGSYYRANRLDFLPVKSVSESSFFNAGHAISLKGFMYKFKSFPSKRLQYGLFKGFNRIRLHWELFKVSNERFSNRLRLNVVYNNGGYIAHCLNSGDFMLMNAENWFEMKGYPEYTSISTHTDAIFTVLAYQRYDEKTFGHPVYHQEHERRYTWDDIKTNEKFQKAYAKFEHIANVVKGGQNTAAYLNSDDWGLKNYDLTIENI